MGISLFLHRFPRRIFFRSFRNRVRLGFPSTAFQGSVKNADRIFAANDRFVGLLAEPAPEFSNLQKPFSVEPAILPSQVNSNMEPESFASFCAVHSALVSESGPAVAELSSEQTLKANAARRTPVPKFNFSSVIRLLSENHRNRFSIKLHSFLENDRCFIFFNAIFALNKRISDFQIRRSRVKIV